MLGWSKLCINEDATEGEIMELPRIAFELGLFLDMTDDIAQSQQLFELDLPRVVSSI